MKSTNIHNHSSSNHSSLNLSTALIAVKLRTSDVHISTLMVGSLLQILGFEFAMLIIAIRFLDRESNRIKDVRRLLEDSVHLFERPVAGLREEEVYTGEHECVSAIVSSKVQVMA